MNDVMQDWINGGAGKIGAVDAFMRFSAKDLVFVFPLLLIGLWFWPSIKEKALNQRVAFSSALCVLCALAVGGLLGHLFYDSRPFVSDASTRLLVGHSPDNGFPSDHATVAFAAVGPLLWFHRRLALVAFLLASLVGVARIFVGVHWPSDIMAAAAIGLGIGAMMAKLVPVLIGPQLALSRLLPEGLVANPGSGA
jgi:undecaprenyl-diphosphatase